MQNTKINDHKHQKSELQTFAKRILFSTYVVPYREFRRSLIRAELIPAALARGNDGTEF